jgi:DNA-directed RNA polymerase subunit RPC12/RpoP
VRKLIAGPNVYICVECVELCNEIIGEADTRLNMGRAVSEVMAGTAVGQLFEPVAERMRRAPAEVMEALGNFQAALEERFRPLVAETVARLTCPHCGKRLDEPTGPAIPPSDAPLKEV